MSDLFWLTEEQIERLRPFPPKRHGKPSVDGRRVLSGVVFVNRDGLRWRDAPSDYGSLKTLYNRGRRWGEAGVFARMMEGLAVAGAEPQTVIVGTGTGGYRRSTSTSGTAWLIQPSAVPAPFVPTMSAPS